MFWPDTQTGVDVQPERKAVQSAVRKYFTEGGVGVPPTVPGGDWFNQITNELLNVLAAAGIDPSKVDDDQLLTSIKNIINSVLYQKGIDINPAGDLVFSTAGVSRLTILNNGFVGLSQSLPTAKLHVNVDNNVSVGGRFSCSWTGETGDSYQNNDAVFTEVHNRVISNSENLSWGVSASNSYNNIPAGITDSGFRVGVLGWATSVNTGAEIHEGVLNEQFGLWGKSGFQGSGPFSSPPGAVVNHAVSVKGQVLSDSAETIIHRATAGFFDASGYAGIVEDNYSLYARASGGLKNWSFYGAEGEFFNYSKSFFNSLYSDIDSIISCRIPGNSFGFGFPDVGYGSSFGATASQGYPFLAFCSSHQGLGDSFTTQGKIGHVIYSNLDGLLRFCVLPSSNEIEQVPIPVFDINQTANAVFYNRPTFPNQAPLNATSPGQKGQFAWDSSYIYICIDEDTWRRTPLSTW